MHSEVLNEQNKTLFPLLKHFPAFYLAGGTAIALQIGHRISVDFDLFSADTIPKSLLQKIKKTFVKKTIVPSVNNADELTIFIDNVKVTFLAYPFPVLYNFVSYNGVHLLSLQELAATKAYTIGRRGSYKDYIDLYFILLENHTTLADIIDIAQKKYMHEFNARLFLEQLLYIDDLENTNIVFLKKKVTKNILTAFFEKKIQEMQL